MGDDLDQAAPLVLALALATAIGSAHTAPQVVGNARGEPWAYLRPTVLASTAHLLGITLGLLSAGLRGAAVGILLAAALAEVEYMVVTRRRFGALVVRQILSTSGILAAVCAFAALAAHLAAGRMEDLTAVLVGGAAYAVLLCLGVALLRNRLLVTSGSRA